MTAPQTITITICGSMQFFDQMLQVAADETAKCRVVLMPYCVVPSADQGAEFKAMLDRLHRVKIDMSDSIIIVTNQHGYIGQSTRAEMVHAAQTGKSWDIREFKLPEPTPNNHGGPLFTEAGDPR